MFIYTATLEPSLLVTWDSNVYRKVFERAGFDIGQAWFEFWLCHLLVMNETLDP